MLDVGTSFCRKCGCVSRGFYYHNSSTHLKVVLKRNAMNKFFVKPIVEKNSPTFEKVYLNQNIDKNNTMFYSTINVAVGAGNSEQSYPYNRVCPGCGEYLANPDIGLVPTYVIAVIGSPGAGKSSWINSIAHDKNLSKINAMVSEHGGYVIETEGLQYPCLSKKTDIGEDGCSRLVYITEQKTAKKVAAVLFMDFSGELFQRKHKETFVSGVSSSVFSKSDGYNGVDAVVFLDSADQTEADAIETKNQLLNTNLLQTLPVAYILNKIDYCFKTYPETELYNQDRRAPLFTPKTFSATALSSVSRKDLNRRTKLQTYLAGKMRTTAEEIFRSNRHAKGFLVKTGESRKATTTEISDYKKKNGNEQESSLTAYAANAHEIWSVIDYSDSINAVDPLLWLLNKIDIFPIR